MSRTFAVKGFLCGVEGSDFGGSALGGFGAIEVGLPVKKLKKAYIIGTSKDKLGRPSEEPAKIALDGESNGKDQRE